MSGLSIANGIHREFGDILNAHGAARVAKYVERIASDAARAAERALVENRVVLPDPKGGCACTPFSQSAGGVYVEHLAEYEPACPEHSDHLYDPRSGEWVLRPEAAEPTMMTFAEDNGRRGYDCFTCAGSGREVHHDLPDVSSRVVDCRACDGTGRRPAAPSTDTGEGR